MSIFKREYYSLRRLKRMGVKVVGREVYISRTVRISRGVKVYSPCHITGSTQIYGGATLLCGCVVENAKIGAGSTVGPYARLRPGSVVGENAKIGNFVELKNADVGAGSKVCHLSYLGDCTLGRGVNVGCGVVFANYNGATKQRSTVEDGVFIGCNSVIIAPAHIGAGAYIAAGTTLAGDVPGGSLAIGRAALHIKPRGGEGRYING